MIDELKHYYAEANERLTAMRSACTVPVPDIGMLCRARHGLISISVQRSKYIKTVVFPALASTESPDLIEKIDKLEKDLSRKRLLSSQHVSRWSIDAILQDWEGYQVASVRIARGVEDRIRLEKSVLFPALRSAAQK